MADTSAGAPTAGTPGARTRSHPRRFRLTLLATVAATVAASSAVTVASWSAAPPAQAALSPVGIPGRGATVPFREQEAEDVATNGTVIGPNRLYTTLPSEASGRRAVTLDAAGEYVEFTLTAPANAMVLRYSIPDNAAGTGITAPIDLRVNGTKLKDLSLTSRYGWYYGGYPFTNNPGAGNPHHFYDEVRTMFGSTLAAGTKVRVQVASTAISPTFTIDLADFELVGAPIAQPANSISVVSHGADPSGAADSTAAIQAAANAGASQGREVWIPQGRFKVTGHIIVDRVTLRGAGPWYSELAGNRVGVYGKYVNQGGPSQNVTLRDFAILGEVMERNDSDQVNAIGGAMSNSVVSNVWMQHNKVGAWMDGPMTNFTIRDSRILDQTADGVNFHYGVTNSTVTNTFVRNTGDDALAMWAENVPNVNNKFTFNTVGVTVLANNIAIYGGRDITVSDNVVADTVTNGGGIHVGNRYPGVNSGSGTAVSGTFTIARNTLIRAGNSDYNWNFGVGAIWFNALNEPMTQATINVTDTDILDSSYAAIHFIEGTVRGVNFTNVNIDGAGTYALQIQSPGSASFTNVRARNIAQSNPIHNCVGSGFEITQGAGNSGWYTATPYCGPWPAPVWGGGPSNPPTNPPTTPPTQPPANVNLAQGRPVTETSHTDVYVATNAVDGNANTYWESANHAFPQSLTVDLGSARSVSRLVLKLPPISAWQTRTQTLSVLGSTDGSSYSTVVNSAGYTFNPASGNSVTISFAATSRRYLRLTFTGNTGWPAGQLSEFEVYAG
ncbi:Pectate lyase superfamily protein [Micromonospora pattaloongensis]|uniref:Pectate lyase superfamily protein n=1 Tax=Micromonospora pattaloongensis TaxID=405436 RepID=A0A1H3IC89_9ACTN|nr:discoidin domain-containing protein [Micromonospora pattaloongensis]SDY25132.1 Pectate lyase superfamily protein [Micromonospora pattaloongensis]